MIKEWLNFCLAVLTAGTFYGQQAVDGTLLSQEPVPSPEALSGSYTMVVEGFDWGPGVSQVVLELEEKVTQVSPEQFLVVEEKQARENSSTDIFATSGPVTIARSQRTVTDAFLSDGEGRETKGPSNHVTLELTVAPDVGSPLCFFSEELHYRWADPYQLVIELAPDQKLKAEGKEYDSLAISRTPKGKRMPLADKFQTDTFIYKEETIQYAHYAPGADGGKHPLVIWLHGLGEGGEDPTIALLGNRVTTFVDNDFQGHMNKAYVLVPQCPTMWLDGGQDGEESRYLESLMALIRRYAGSSPEIDPDRIYIGGCSNGGYMTMALLLEDPDFFAAAFPVCQAYQDSWLSDSEIARLAKVPMWFIHSELDQVCPPGESTFPTVQRLLAAGAKDVRLTRLGLIVDGSGLPSQQAGMPYRYNPHYSWVPVLNGRCVDQVTGETLFQWLARQGRNR